MIENIAIILAVISIVIGILTLLFTIIRAFYLWVEDKYYTSFIDSPSLEEDIIAIFFLTLIASLFCLIWPITLTVGIIWGSAIFIRYVRRRQKHGLTLKEINSIIWKDLKGNIKKWLIY